MIKYENVLRYGIRRLRFVKIPYLFVAKAKITLNAKNIMLKTS